jgi:hypothetical protein
MRTSIRKSWFRNTGGLIAGLGILASVPCFALSDAGVPQAIGAVNSQVSFSPGMRDILKMLDAKVDLSVIKAYINNSPIPFNPNASEIIALKQRGVPDEIITVLIQHGAEVRTQMAQAAVQAATSAPGPNASPAGYASDYGTTAPYSYPYDYSDYGYGYPSYPYYSYPYNYWWYNSYYPWSFGSSFFFDFYGRRHFGGFDRFHRFDGFHRFGNGSFAFHGRPGVVGHSGAWGAAVGRGSRSFAGHSSFVAHSFAAGGSRPGGFSGHVGGFAARSGGFAGHVGGFAGHGGGFGGHSGGFGGHGGGGHR